jgi:hypothetical protein
MTHEYDLFEKFSDGSSLWRVSVYGLKNARFQLRDLIQGADSQFYAIDVNVGKTLHFRARRNGQAFESVRPANPRGQKTVSWDYGHRVRGSPRRRPSGRSLDTG